VDTVDSHLRQIYESMTRDINDPWTRVELVATGVGSGIDLTRTLLLRDGGRISLPFDMDGGVAVVKLRESMWESQQGTWYIGQFFVDPAGGTGATYDYESIPLHPGSSETPDDIRDELLEDQELFPRDPERLAAWHPARNSDRSE
jgi:hypothetical protein